MAKQVVTKDISHRAKGLWAIDSANPNAWAGAEEYLSSTGAEVATFQETKVGHEATSDKEATATNMGWTTSLRPCVTGPGGGNYSGVAVACTKHIGMQHSCDDDMYPASCQGRLLVRKVGAICRGGYHQATAYLHNSLGLMHPKNLTLLQDIACVLRTLHRAIHSIR